MITTIEARIKEPTAWTTLAALGEFYGRIERKTYVDLFIRQLEPNAHKRGTCARDRITSRQYNSILQGLKGKVAALDEARGRHQMALQRQVTRAKERLKTQRSRNARHHVKRRVASLTARLSVANRSKPSLCFGSRRLFRAQFALEENSYIRHDVWKSEWTAQRSAQFYCLGSKSEPCGNYTCTILNASFENGVCRATLRLRLPNAAPWNGDYLHVPVQFSYDVTAIQHALAVGQAINYRFIRRNAKWYVQLSTKRTEVPIATDRSRGALGIDLNPGRLSIGQIGADGNAIDVWDDHTFLHRRRTQQVTQTLSEAVCRVVTHARNLRLPVVIEKLDFTRKKQELGTAKGNRRLSNFAYAKFHALMASRCAKEGVELITVNPAYTSVIGIAKFAVGYGLSRHGAAAVAIARRGLGFSEKLRARRARSALDLPARNRSRHVWSDWSRVKRGLSLSSSGWQFDLASKSRRRPGRTQSGRTALLSTSPQGADDGPIFEFEATSLDSSRNCCRAGARKEASVKSKLLTNAVR